MHICAAVQKYFAIEFISVFFTLRFLLWSPNLWQYFRTNFLMTAAKTFLLHNWPSLACPRLHRESFFEHKETPDARWLDWKIYEVSLAKNLFPFVAGKKIFCLRSRGSTQTNYDHRFSLPPMSFGKLFSLSFFFPFRRRKNRRKRSSEHSFRWWISREIQKKISIIFETEKIEKIFVRKLILLGQRDFVFETEENYFTIEVCDAQVNVWRSEGNI